jgi:hypothetical protein
MTALNSARWSRPARRPWLIAAAFTAATFLAIAAGAMHILVWNPLARLPGLSIDEIYAGLRAAGEGTLAGGFVVTWAVFWAALAVLFVILCAIPVFRPVLTVRRVAVVGLLLVGGTCAFTWFAGFNMGMSIADAFATGGGDAAVSGPLIAIVGVVSLVLALIVGAGLRRPAEPERPSVPA